MPDTSVSAGVVYTINLSLTSVQRPSLVSAHDLGASARLR